MNASTHKEKLIHVLRMAYSGEKAAALAYSAHWRSLKPGYQRQQIRVIEQEEWEHRLLVGAMLSQLASKPTRWREVLMEVIGRTVGLACYVIGWFLPMYFAGRLEHENVNEYDVAAFHAGEVGLVTFQEELLRLSVVEHDHERFFLDAIRNHPLLPVMSALFGWGMNQTAITVGKLEGKTPCISPSHDVFAETTG